MDTFQLVRGPGVTAKGCTSAAVMRRLKFQFDCSANRAVVAGLEIQGAPFFLGQPAKNRWESTHPSRPEPRRTKQCGALERALKNLCCIKASRRASTARLRWSTSLLRAYESRALR